MTGTFKRKLIRLWQQPNNQLKILNEFTGTEIFNRLQHPKGRNSNTVMDDDLVNCLIFRFRSFHLNIMSS